MCVEERRWAVDAFLCVIELLLADVRIEQSSKLLSAFHPLPSAALRDCVFLSPLFPLFKSARIKRARADQ
jgi:hypothetical protein